MEEFYSQICTTIEQSQRLLDLGLNPETADMVYTNASLPYNKDVFHVICKEYLQLHKEVNYEISPFTFIPAWSLHRLIEISEVSVEVSGLFVRISSTYYYEGKDNVYDNLIDAISELINNEVFNKKYLKQ